MKFIIIVCLILVLFCLVTRKKEHFSATDSTVDVEALQNLASMLTKDGEVKLSNLRITNNLVVEKSNTHLGLQLLPIGTIIAWNGDEIPEGWKLCDGEGNIPNLIDKFIVGGNKNEVVDATDKIELTSNVTGGHTHNINVRRTSEKVKVGARGNPPIGDSGNMQTQNDGDHAHLTPITNEEATNLLSKATLVFIIKVGNIVA